MYYGPERQLYKQVQQGGVEGTKTTIWAGGIYQKEIQNSIVTHKYHIPVKGGISAIVHHKDGEIPETHYLHRGSPGLHYRHHR